ncbi:hypothetical protein BDZ89DRAFT_564800 [Hymenopellis radicata]|nr:hypothetical protein BDZ89DRAFT_564800 [Hymenopellis radicata]
MASHTGPNDGTVNIVHGTHSQLIAFLVLNMWPSHLGLPLLLVIIFCSKKVQRHPTFINLCFTFIIVGISSSLLVYAGKTEGPEPSRMLCLLQASLLYGYPAMASLSAFGLVFQMFMVIRRAFHGQTDSPSFIRRWSILILPYVAWFISILATACVGAVNPNSVSRNRRFFYCSVKSDTLTNTITVFAAIFLFITFVLEVWTVYYFYKRWSAVKRNDSASVFTEINLSIRILAFAVYLIIAMSLSLLSIKSPASPVPDLAIASGEWLRLKSDKRLIHAHAAATVVILIFGTQPDILKAACFWRRRKSLPPVDGSVQDGPIFIDLSSNVGVDQGHKPVWRSSETFAPRVTTRF